MVYVHVCLYACTRLFVPTLPDSTPTPRAADVMIGCTANAVRSCDPIEAAEATDGVKRQVISVFGPNSVTNCQLREYAARGVSVGVIRLGSHPCIHMVGREPCIHMTGWAHSPVYT